MNKFVYIILLSIMGLTRAFTQYPQHFIYDDENGLPSNEVYSIVQDQNGFIWLGCDAGLYKFDGVRYIPYKCSTQKSKSITGLTITSSGKIYCYNFHSQIFCLDNDSLKELKYTLPNAVINNLVSDIHQNIYVTHSGGISRYNETQKQWKDFFQYSPDATLKSMEIQMLKSKDIVILCIKLFPGNFFPVFNTPGGKIFNDGF